MIVASVRMGEAPGIAVATKCDGVARAISPDARFRHPAFRSLDGNHPSPSWLRAVSNAVSIGTGNPSD
jgi:hypothetical protein